MGELVLLESKTAKVWIDFRDSDDRIQNLEIDRFSPDVTVRVKIWPTEIRAGTPSLDRAFAKRTGRAGMGMASRNLKVRSYTSRDPDDVVLPTDRKMSVAWAVTVTGGLG